MNIFKVILIMLFFCTTNGFSQDNDTNQPAQPILGFKKLRNYIAQNFSSDNSGVINPNQDVIVNFEVDTLGSLQNFIIVNAKDYLEKIIIRTLKNGPKWKSAVINGEKTSQKIELPIRFYNNRKEEETEIPEAEPDSITVKFTNSKAFQNNDFFQFYCDCEEISRGIDLTDDGEEVNFFEYKYIGSEEGTFTVSFYNVPNQTPDEFFHTVMSKLNGVNAFSKITKFNGYEAVEIQWQVYGFSDLENLYYNSLLFL